MVGDHDLETPGLGLGDLVNGGDPTVDREHEPDAVVGQPGERRAGHAVAFLEAAGKVPSHVGAELT